MRKSTNKFHDNIILDEERIFATTVGNAENNDQFNDERHSFMPETKSGSQTPSAISLIGWESLHINPSQNEVKSDNPGNYLEPMDFIHTHSQNATTLNNCWPDLSPLVNNFRNPNSLYSSPMSSCGPNPSIPAQEMVRLPPSKPTSFSLRRQTAPFLGSVNSSLGSSMNDMQVSPLCVTEPIGLSRPGTTILTPFTSNPSSLSMAAQSNINFNSDSAINFITSSNVGGSFPSFPSQEEARAALFTFMTFIEHQPNGAVDPHDYFVMAKWMHMLTLETGNLSNGIYTIPMNEGVDGTVPIGSFF